ncbi:MAG TPA: hypothetical protein VGJ91_08125 [Polyangiaceae bacterium]
MFTEASLIVAEPRPRAWRQHSGDKKVAKAPRGRSASTPPATPSPSKKRAGRRVTSAARVPRIPEGWQSRLREQSHNLARAIEMLEQAMAMMNEPKTISLTRAECLRGAGLLTLLAASELLVVAGWFEADHAVSAGTLPR